MDHTISQIYLCVHRDSMVLYQRGQRGEKPLVVFQPHFSRKRVVQGVSTEVILW